MPRYLFVIYELLQGCAIVCQFFRRVPSLSADDENKIRARSRLESSVRSMCASQGIKKKKHRQIL